MVLPRELSPLLEPNVIYLKSPHARVTLLNPPRPATVPVKHPLTGRMVRVRCQRVRNNHLTQKLYICIISSRVTELWSVGRIVDANRIKFQEIIFLGPPHIIPSQSEDWGICAA
jgi:hypothetical protein